ncbi:MAG: hypothetical protein H7343_01110 [Undibacterium sp.]|nr:hypothetical protein [Opitutaceae bacterium]
MNPSAHPPTPAERRQRLALMCELDRLHLRLALRPPAHRPEITLGGVPVSALTKAFSLVQFLPGKLGRFARGAALGAGLFRGFNPFTR